MTWDIVTITATNSVNMVNTILLLSCMWVLFLMINKNVNIFRRYSTK